MAKVKPMSPGTGHNVRYCAEHASGVQPDGEESDIEPLIAVVQEFPVQQEQIHCEGEFAKNWPTIPDPLVPVAVDIVAELEPKFPGAGHEAGTCMEQACGVQPDAEEADIE